MYTVQLKAQLSRKIDKNESDSQTFQTGQSAQITFTHRYAVTKSDWKLSPTQCERHNYGKRVSCRAKFYATANLIDCGPTATQLWLVCLVINFTQRIRSRLTAWGHPLRGR